MCRRCRLHRLEAAVAELHAAGSIHSPEGVVVVVVVVRLGAWWLEGVPSLGLAMKKAEGAQRRRGRLMWAGMQPLVVRITAGSGTAWCEYGVAKEWEDGEMVRLGWSDKEKAVREGDRGTTGEGMRGDGWCG